MEKVKKKKKKDWKLLFQVGVFFAIIFPLLIGVSALIQVKGNIYSYLEAKQEFLKPLSSKMIKYFDYMGNPGWFFDFWAKYPEVAKAFMNTEDEYYREMTNDFPFNPEVVDFDLPSYDPDKLDTYTKRQKGQLAVYMYQEILTFELLSIFQMQNERFMVIDVSDELWGTCYYDSSDYMDILWSDDDLSEGQNSLGKDYSEVLNALSGIKDVKRTKTTTFERFDSPKDGNYYYLCMAPILSKGEVRAVLVLSNDWSEYHSTVMRQLLLIVGISALVILVASILLLYLINRSAIRPLGKVQKGVREYIVTKQSAPIVQKMNEIRQRNEFGVLADDVSQLVVEMDRHTSEIEKLTGERERVATELSLAANIQMGVLPVNFPNEPDYEIHASMTPAKEVGGDLYDFFDIDDTHLGLVIGDVSGKGVPASLFMMISKLLIQEYGKSNISPAMVLAKANQTLCKNNTNDMFVTVWFGILDRTTGKITAASAGHEFPILRDPDGEFRLIKDRHGFVLGGMEMSRYKDYELELQPGGTLLLYTDGAAEATNAENELFGTDRMLDALNQHLDDHPKEVIAHLTEAIEAFVGDAPQFDDLTMLCVRYNGQS
ncbi:MAG: PP2C family protein-serine/threonine phosphatase [Eubacterium sp.]|nr:PP2C family protein-serine/threonine phosphatase [Eubacterium sp.]